MAKKKSIATFGTGFIVKHTHTQYINYENSFSICNDGIGLYDHRFLRWP